ncbi:MULTISPECIES: hypothetical protein [Bacillus]|uniref:hypothetical protein n=1 Tax=Bacillus TaxID=1386 RepID=UPI0005A327CC|nr:MULTISPECIES: hypothetical protein [Bacillus cereus group]AJG62022.1 hypothetical protein AW22_5302 [Bacillus cereus D17]QKI12763.1 hypothetical protein FOC91_12455 [Bacillus cereus]USL01984.1 hypothetical protein LIS83_24485 [Bacillus anthracis]
MIKKCVVLNGNVIHIGDWDFMIVSVVAKEAEYDIEGNLISEPIIENKETNPLPQGATIEERRFDYSKDKGWFEVGAVSLPTSEERISQLEDTVNYLLGL